MAVSVIAVLDQGGEALAHDELDRAEIAYRAALALDPVNMMAIQGLSEIARLRRSPVLVVDNQAPRMLPLDCVVRLAVPLCRLVANDIAPREALVLSRLVSGPLAVEDLIHLCDATSGEVCDILSWSVSRGLLALVE